MKEGPNGEDGGHLGCALYNQVTAMGCAYADCTGTNAGYPYIVACNMNQDMTAKQYPPQPIPSSCPLPGTVVPYHRIG
jgi:hypothetical protein